MSSISKTWVCSDHHFGHANILKFERDDGTLIRGAVFTDIEDHDNEIVRRHNELVSDSDRVYLLGDLAINRRCIRTVSRLKGRLVLIKGNHDIFKLSDYSGYFDDIRAYVVQKDSDGNKVILSHIPVHPDSLGRFGTNIHGHMHENKLNDPNYVCVSLEHTGYKPIELHEALKLRGVRKH